MYEIKYKNVNVKTFPVIQIIINVTILDVAGYFSLFTIYKTCYMIVMLYVDPFYLLFYLTE